MALPRRTPDARRAIGRAARRAARRAPRAAAIAAWPLAAVWLALAPSGAAADEPYRAAREVLDARATVVGEPLRYPAGEAEVRAIVLTLAPGEETAAHVHPAPLFAYILEGELTVDYGEHGKRTYRAGDALLEAMKVPHAGKNTGEVPVRLLAVFLGAKGVPGTAPPPPPSKEGGVWRRVDE